jgi:hypothetical protein
MFLYTHFTLLALVETDLYINTLQPHLSSSSESNFVESARHQRTRRCSSRDRGLERCAHFNIQLLQLLPLNFELICSNGLTAVPEMNTAKPVGRVTPTP